MFKIRLLNNKKFSNIKNPSLFPIIEIDKRRIFSMTAGVNLRPPAAEPRLSAANQLSN